MIHRQTVKAEVYKWPSGTEQDVLERLRHIAASKLCIWHEHGAGGKSLYVFVGENLKLRFADHANTSEHHRQPDFNIVNRCPTEEEVSSIIGRIGYPKYCKQTAFALHTKVTVPKLKTVLPAECFENVCENDFYPNTFTKYIVVALALSSLKSQGFTERVPVRQEIYSVEDYNGL